MEWVDTVFDESFIFSSCQLFACLHALWHFPECVGATRNKQKLE
jgi:hypothetical protein